MELNKELNVFKKTASTIILLVIANCTFSQPFQVKGTIKNFPLQRVKLSAYSEGDIIAVDSASTGLTGEFSLNLSNEFNAGLYQLSVGKNQLDFIFNKSDVNIIADYNNLNDLTVSDELNENQNYFKYIGNAGKFQQKIELLQPIISYYPKDSKFFETAKNEFIQIQKEQIQFEDELISNNPESFASKIIKAKKTMYIEPGMDVKEQNLFIRQNYFSVKTLSDTALLNTNILSKTLIDYLSMYSNRNFTKSQQEMEYIKAVQVLLDNTRDNQKIYEFTIDYLVDGFQNFNFERVTEYIAQASDLENVCVNSERKERLQKKLDGINKVALGKMSPDFTFPDIYGNKITLSAIEANYTFVVFWASWCPHCHEMLPELKKVYNKLKGTENPIEVIAISVDSDKKAFANSIEKGQYNWTNIAELKGWDGMLPELFSVFATPTVFVLDNNKKIVSKPITTQELLTFTQKTFNN